VRLGWPRRRFEAAAVIANVAAGFVGDEIARWLCLQQAEIKN
jgi:hypothetical protein